ncbi:hypothetical protein FJZ20_02305 [Candidatus Pacearchaeota archaeon]|nr:hypothetical protein [Candidatus Pacearchaeota archaeon]
MRDRSKLLIGILIAIIVILAAIVVYAFVVQPGITGYATERQQEGYLIALSEVVQTAAQCQPISLPIGEGAVITLIAAECYPEIFGAPQQTQQQSE